MGKIKTEDGFELNTGDVCYILLNGHLAYKHIALPETGYKLYKLKDNANNHAIETTKVFSVNEVVELFTAMGLEPNQDIVNTLKDASKQMLGI